MMMMVVVVHTVAVAPCSYRWCFVWIFLFFCVVSTFGQLNKIYGQHDFLKLGVCHERSVTDKFFCTRYRQA